MYTPLQPGCTRMGDTKDHQHKVHVKVLRGCPDPIPDPRRPKWKDIGAPTLKACPIACQRVDWPD